MSSKIDFLVSLKLMSGRNPDKFKDLLRRLSEYVDWKSISAIYRVVRSADSFQGLRQIRGEETLDGFACVVRGATWLEPLDLLNKIQLIEKLESDQRLKRAFSCNCLVYGDTVSRTPQLTLPHPEFHFNPEEAIPSAELWPEYEHPILKRSLAEISRDFAGKSWGEYYGPGQPLLDF